MTPVLRPAERPFWKHVNETHHWVRRSLGGTPSRYYDCAKCGQFVCDLAKPQEITWPWRFNTVGPCATPAQDHTRDDAAKETSE